MVQLGGEFSNSSSLHLLLQKLEDWEGVLKAEPDFIHQLQSLDAVAEDRPETPAPSPKLVTSPRRHMRGPSL